MEGEGNFSTNSNRHPSQVARATQKNLEPLYRLQALFGGSVGKSRRDARWPDKEYGEWRAYGARARGVMFTLFSFLSARRREQIKVALSGGY